MDRSDDIPSLNTTKISYPVTNEDGKKTSISPSQRMSLMHFPAESPQFSPKPLSTLFQSSPVFSPFLSLIPSSPSLSHDSPSAPVENIDSSAGFNNNLSMPPMMSPTTGLNTKHFMPLMSYSVGFNNNHSRPLVIPSIGFNINHSTPLVSPSFGFKINPSQPLTIPSPGLKHNPSLPPEIPFRKSNPMRVSCDTQPARKPHKRSKCDIIGLNSMVPQSSPELNDPKSLEQLIGKSNRGKESLSEMQSDEEFEKEFNVSRNWDFSAFNFNENGDEIYINISNLEDVNNALESDSKNGSTSSGVKRRAVQECDRLSEHYRNVSLDSCFNDLLKKPPLPPVNPKGTNSVYGNNIDGSDSTRVRRILANRRSYARSKEKKDGHISHLEHKKNKTALMFENKCLTIQLESMEQQEKLGEAMTKQLNA